MTCSDDVARKALVEAMPGVGEVVGAAVVAELGSPQRFRSAKAYAKATGLTPEHRISNGGLDANWMTEHGIPTASFGVGQHEIHTVSEYLDVAEFHQGCEIALRLACG